MIEKSFLLVCFCLSPGSSADEAPISRRKIREPNSQIKPTTEVLRNEAKGPVTSAADAPPSRSQIPLKERERERELEYNKPVSSSMTYSVEIRPEDFSFNKGKVSSSYSVPTSGNATPVLGLSVHTLSSHGM